MIFWKILYWTTWMWQFPQNIIGWLISRKSEFRRLFPGGAQVYRKSWEWPVLVLGNYIFLSKDAYGGPLTRYSYGRWLQSLILGPLYFPVILIPSLIWLAQCKNEYYFMEFYTESWARRLIKKDRKRKPETSR